MIQFREITELELEDYSSNTVKTYTKNYRDVDEEMPKSFIEIHKAKNDKNGYMTLRKTIYAIIVSQTHVGFTTLTFKRGGSVKTGPTILFPSFQGKGLGPEIQREIQAFAKSSGYRKTYGTVSSNAPHVLKYMLKAGYKQECILKYQYHEEWDEIILGKILKEEAPFPPPVNFGHILKNSSIENASRLEVLQYKEPIINLYNEYLVQVDDNFIQSLANSTSTNLSSYSNKPRRLHLIKENNFLVGVICFIPKRGGTIKINSLGASNSEALATSMKLFIENATVKFRKFTLYIPNWDERLKDSAICCDFTYEGELYEPYRPGINLLVFSKFL